MKNMNLIGNKHEITMYQWYEILANAEKKLQDSIECNKRFGDNEDWVKDDTAKVESVKKQIEEVKQFLESNNIFVDYDKVKSLVKI